MGTERLFATMKPFMSSSLINKVKYTHYLLLFKKLKIINSHVIIINIIGND